MYNRYIKLLFVTCWLILRLTTTDRDNSALIDKAIASRGDFQKMYFRTHC